MDKWYYHLPKKIFQNVSVVKKKIRKCQLRIKSGLLKNEFLCVKAEEV